MKRLLIAIAAAATTMFASAAVLKQAAFEGTLDGGFTDDGGTVTRYNDDGPEDDADYPFSGFGDYYCAIDADSDSPLTSSVSGTVFDMFVQFKAVDGAEVPNDAKIAIYLNSEGKLVVVGDQAYVCGSPVAADSWARLTIAQVSGGYKVYVGGIALAATGITDYTFPAKNNGAATTVAFTGSGKLDNFVARTTNPFDQPSTYVASVGGATGERYATFADALDDVAAGSVIELNGDVDGTFALPAAGAKIKLNGYTFSGFASVTGNPHLVAVASTADGVTTYSSAYFPRTATAGQDGSAEHPYEIADVDDLKALQAYTEGYGLCYVQTADIALDAAWPGIGIQNGKDVVAKAEFDNGAFTGTYDGGNYTISNFQMVDGLDYCGFFNSVKGATIKNLKISYKDGSFAKDMVAAKEVCGATFVGVAKASTLQNLTSLAGTVSCTKGFGGIVGYLMAGSTVDSCTNNVNLTSTASNKAGGIAMITQGGSGTATIRNCQNNGTTAGNANQKGGIVGYVGVATAIADCEDTAGSDPSFLHHQSGTLTITGVNKAPAGVKSYTKNATNIDGLNLATVDNGVATFVKSADLALGNTYKVMGPGAAYMFEQAGTLTLDQSLATATVTADTSKFVFTTSEPVDNVTTYTAVAGVASITKNNVTTLYATLQDAVTAANADADVNTVKLVGAATGAVSIPEGITVQLVAGYSLNGVTSLSGAGVLAMPWGEAPQQVIQLLCQQSTWGGTLFIQGVDIDSAINLTLLGNANSTVCFNNAGCAFTANNTAVHTIKALEIGPDGLDFIGEYSSGTFTFPCALTGTGMLKIAAKNSSGGTALKVAKFTGDVSGFAGSISFADGANCAVYFGDSLGNGNCISVGAGKSVTVAAGKTWTAPAGFVVKGNMTVNGTLSAGNEKLYGDGTITFNAPTSLVVANSWTGTYNANFKAANNAVFYIPVNASATTVINGVNGEFGGFPKFGSGAPTVAGPVTLNANWTVADGWNGTDYTTTFAKLSGSGNLTVNGSGSGDKPIYYTITELSDYTGTIGGRRGNFTISKVNVATKPASRAIVVKTNIGTNGSINDNVPLYVAGVETGKTLTYDANGASGAGLYAPQMEVAIVIPPVANTTVSATANGTPVEIVDGKITVDDGAAVVLTYTSTTHEVTGGTIEFTAADGYTVDVSGVTATAYVAKIDGGSSYTSLQAAVDATAQSSSKIVLVSDEAAGATVPAVNGKMFYFYAGSFEHGEILNAPGNFITTVTQEQISIGGETVTAAKYRVEAAFMAVTISGTRTLYGMASANDAIAAANAGPLGTTVEFFSGDPASYAQYLPMFTYDAQSGIYTKTLEPVAAVYSGVQQLSVHTSLAAAFAEAQDGNTVKLLAGVAVTEMQLVTKSVTLDLNGFAITAGERTAEAAAAKDDAILCVLHGGSLTINDSSAGGTGAITGNSVFTSAVKMTKTGDTDDTKKAVLVVNGGTLTGYYYGISGNGLANRGNTEVTINGGSVYGSCTDDSVAIFQPQLGTLTINGGYLEGAMGVYVKSGTATVAINGGTIKGKGTYAAYVYSKNGFNNTGDAFVVDNAGYPGGAPAPSILGGTFVSVNASAIASYAKTGLARIVHFADKDAVTITEAKASSEDVFLEKGFPGGEDGKTFTIDDAVQTALEAKLPTGKALTDPVAGTTSGLTYAQAYALDLFDEDTGTVEDVKPTIEIVNGKVVVSLDATAKAGYKVMLNVYVKASLTAQWPEEPTTSYELGSKEEAAGFTPSGSGFYKIGVTIEDAE